MAARYREVADVLRVELAPGAALATEAELQARFEVSRSTVRAALCNLRDEGLVVSRRGSGWYALVPVSPMRWRVGAVDSDTEAAITRAGSARVKVRRPPVDVAELLGVGRRYGLLMVERINAVNGSVVHVATTWFGKEASAVISPDSARSTPPGLLAVRSGLGAVRVEQYVEAVAATEIDAARFGLDLDAPVLQVVRIARASSGEPVFVSLHRHPGRSVQIAIDLPTTIDDDEAVVGFTEVSRSRRVSAPASSSSMS